MSLPLGFSLPLTARSVALYSLTLAVTAACQHSRAPAPVDSLRPEEVDIGYGTAERRDVTKPVSSLGERELERVHVGNVEELLQGRVPGLQVSRLPNGEFSVRIRGTRSFSGNGEPLIVIDGIPSISISRGLARLSPSDVQQIDVLKGAAATMYGSRGANGVILITTKRGR